MFSDYHLVRWNKFFDEVESSIKSNKTWNRTPFLDASCQWEKNWSKNTNLFSAIPAGDPVEVSRSMWQKYAPLMIFKNSR